MADIDPADPLDTDAVLRRNGLLPNDLDTFRRPTTAELEANRARHQLRDPRPLFHPDVPTPAAPGLAAAVHAATGFVHTDPVADPAFPGITAPDPLEDGTPDQFPATWGQSGPSERDQAAIDAAAGPS